VITLVLGGARSGKSALAERLAAKNGPPVTFVATGRVTDDDMAARIAVHQARRPGSWQTVEAAGSELAQVVRTVPGTVLVDALGTWLAGAEDFRVDGAGLCDALVARTGDAVLVSEEVGLGVHPATAVGRQFRDALGLLNQQVAAVADEALLVVAGRVLRLEPAAW
jgi:adenosyl cobinamide kinase/adenosyl cobinamide phosphate guanylyltransferase